MGHFCTTHFLCRTVKHIKAKDLLCDGKFFDATHDVGIMHPMLEMTGGKFKFIDDIIYVYNRLNPLNDHNLRLYRQIYLGKFIASKKKYDALPYNKTPRRNISNNAKADLIIISEENPQHLETMLDSIFLHAQSLGAVSLLLQSCNPAQPSIKKQQELAHIKTILKNYNAIKFLEYTPDNFKEILENTLSTSPHEHIILAKNDMILQSPVCLSSCIKLLEDTYAYGFYLALGQNTTHTDSLIKSQEIPVHTHLHKNVYLWQFQYGHQDWRKPNNLLMTLYRKKNILNVVTRLNYTCVDTLQDLWNEWQFDYENIGLFFKESKAFSLTNHAKHVVDKKTDHKSWLKNIFGENHDV